MENIQQIPILFFEVTNWISERDGWNDGMRNVGHVLLGDHLLWRNESGRCLGCGLEKSGTVVAGGRLEAGGRSLGLTLLLLLMGDGWMGRNDTHEVLYTLYICLHHMSTLNLPLQTKRQTCTRMLLCQSHRVSHVFMFRKPTL